MFPICRPTRFDKTKLDNDPAPTIVIRELSSFF